MRRRYLHPPTRPHCTAPPLDWDVALPSLTPSGMLIPAALPSPLAVQDPIAVKAAGLSPDPGPPVGPRQGGQPTDPTTAAWQEYADVRGRAAPRGAEISVNRFGDHTVSGNSGFGDHSPACVRAANICLHRHPHLIRRYPASTLQGIIYYDPNYGAHWISEFKAVLGGEASAAQLRC